MKLSIINKNIRVYLGKTDDEDEAIFVLLGLREYEFKNLTIEFCENHPIRGIVDIGHFEEAYNCRYREDVSNEKMLVFSKC
ncbi:MAG: hypothetical protein ACRCX2_02135 [Paraclostridium sp.]